MHTIGQRAKAKKALEEVSEAWQRKIEKCVAKLQKKLVKKVAAEITKVCEEFSLDLIEETAKLFVNNQIIATSIENDPAGDWDGGPRAVDLYDEMKAHTDEEQG